jgi:carbon storage regulator
MRLGQLSMKPMQAWSWDRFIMTQGGTGMLVLSRRMGEEIVIDGKIHVRVVSTNGDRVRLGIEAPEGVRVDREEIHRRRAEFCHTALDATRAEVCRPIRG